MYVSCFKCDKIFYKKGCRNVMLKRFCDTCDKDPEIIPVIPPVKTVKPDIIDEFKKVYELTNDEKDYVKSKEIIDWLKINSRDINMTKFGRDINKHCKSNEFLNVKSKQKKIKGSTVQVWIGIKLREIN